jgi:Fic family protein
VKVGNYRAPDWQGLDNLLKELFTWFNKNKDSMHAIELCARMHYKFEKIHPFGDGNGRLGRLIIANILWKNRYPILIIDYKKRKAYYKALSKDEDYFLQYFIRTYIKNIK